MNDDLFRYIKKTKIIVYSNLLFIKKRSFKFIIILLIVQVMTHSFSEKDIETNSHNIFTFWEPSNSLPGYINLCFKTWKKYLPDDYKVIILDFHNLGDYLNHKIINKILCKDLTLQVQSDAIRVAILQKYGGIWMDSDTIITSSNCMNMLYGSDLIMFGHSEKKIVHIGFIYALNNSTILKVWLKNIIKRIRIFKKKLFLKRIFPIQRFKQSFEEILSWNYLGNSILNKIVENAPQKSFKILERDEAYVLPELNFYKDPLICYRDLYFTPGDPEILLKKNKGVLMLHNSYTEEKYKKMPEKEILHQDIMLAHLLLRLLKNDSKIVDTKKKIL